MLSATMRLKDLLDILLDKSVEVVFMPSDKLWIRTASDIEIPNATDEEKPMPMPSPSINECAIITIAP